MEMDIKEEFEKEPDDDTQIVRRILYREDADYGQRCREAAEEIEAIRTEMSDLRTRLREVAKVEAENWYDSTSNDVAGGMSNGIVALHDLLKGQRNLLDRAKRSDELWADAETHPEYYLIKDRR